MLSADVLGPVLVPDAVNKLSIHVKPEADGEACGIYVIGQHAIFDIGQTEALDRATTETVLGIDDLNLGAGDILRVRQYATNNAGLAAVAQSDQLIILDDTPPTHPQKISEITRS